MNSPSDFHQLTPGVALWSRYDPVVKTDLYSSTFLLRSGWLTVDATAPFPTEPPPAPVAGAVVTNANHWRDAMTFGPADTTIYATRETMDASQAGDRLGSPIAAGDLLLGEVLIVGIEGAAPGEIALYHAGHRLLVVGDAVINADPYGFTFLPAKYCLSPKRLRASLHQFLDLDFEMMLFAHGTPVTAGAKKRLQTLLAERKLT